MTKNYPISKLGSIELQNTIIRVFPQPKDYSVQLVKSLGCIFSIDPKQLNKASLNRYWYKGTPMWHLIYIRGLIHIEIVFSDEASLMRKLKEFKLRILIET